MSAAVIGDIIDALAGVLSCSREVIELAVMTLVAGGHLLPSDLTGVSVYSQATGSFDFHPGPLLANIVIADEVNRANPKAQSAMLEAMGEGQISVDGHTHGLRQIRSIERVRDIRAACRRVTLAPEMASRISWRCPRRPVTRRACGSECRREAASTWRRWPVRGR